MKLKPHELSTLSRLTDQWLDLEPHDRENWRLHAISEYPQLRAAIEAFAEPAQSTHLTPELTSNEGSKDPQENGFASRQAIGPYHLDREIGRGGMGTVWLAKQADEHLERTIALKLPWHHLAQKGLRTRFSRERNILAALDHPGIAKLFDAGVTQDGQPYMAMQYVPGIAITQFCDAHHLDIQARLRLFIDLLDAVQHAHSNLVVHRDLKPSNILVTDDRHVVLLDFGIAKLLDADVQDTISASDMAVTEFVGTALTLDYASPEQVAGKQISTRSDIYSLGVILYELLCGQRPYRLRRNSKAALEEAVLGQDINLPSTRVTDRHAQSTHLSNRHIAKTLKGDLDAIVLKALRKAPDDRYATAQALADDLQRWLRKEPVTAQPDRLGYRIRRLVARRWRLIAASSTVAMALVVTASVAMYQAIEATRATKAAQDETRKAQAVTNFLKDLFNTNTLDQVDPGAARKRTAEELLQEGAKRIETALKDAPDQQLELMYLMAEFHDLTKPTELIKRAAEIATAAYGPRHPKTLAAVAKYAHHSPHGGRMENGERALALVEPELPRLINSENVEYRRIAALILDAKLSEYKSKSYQEALGIARQLELLLATLPASEFTKKRHLFLGYVFRDALEFGEAERHLAEAERLRVLEGDFARPAQIVGYALFLSMTGRYREAEVKFLKAHGFERHNDSYQNISGNQFSREIFVEFLCDTSRAAAALALTAAPIRGVGTMERNQKLKPEGSLGSRGLALICFGQIERGLALYSQSDQHMKSKGFNGTGPSDRVYPMLELGRLHDANGYFDEANSGSVDEGLALLTNDRLYFRTRVTLDLAAGNVAGARAALEKSRRILAPPGIGPLQLAQAAWLEASIEQKEQKPDLALLRLEAALDRIAQSPDRLLLREWQAKLEELRGVSLAVLGKPAEAKRSLETALEINKAIFDPKTSIAVGRVALRLAGLHKAAGRASSAKTYQVQADAIRRTHPMFEQWVL